MQRSDSARGREENPFVSLFWRMHRAYPAARGDSLRVSALRLEEDSATAAVLGRTPWLACVDTMAFRLARGCEGWRIDGFANLPAADGD